MKVKNSFFVAATFALLAFSGCSLLKKDNGEDDVNKGGQSTAKLVSYYTFDGQNAYDSSGNEYDGAPQGAVTYITNTPSGSGYAAHLNGFKGAFINIPYNVFAGQYSYSVAFWIKDFTLGLIFTAISSDGVRSDFPRFYGNAANHFRFVTSYDNWDTTPAFEDYNYLDIMAPDWHHIAVVTAPRGQTNGDVDRRLYVDGIMVTSDAGYTQAYFNMHGYDEDIIRSIQIGGDRNGMYVSQITMDIDNIRFYHGALTNAEVKELYNGRK